MSSFISNAARLRQLAAERPHEVVYRHIAVDGCETAFTATDIFRRSSQVAGALAARGVTVGDRVAIGLRNSPQFTLAVLASWQLGATPIPVRWDLPAWEADRVRAVIDPRQYVGDDSVEWIDATADLDVPDLPDAVAPSASGICSSGSTGTPKVILRAEPSVFNPLLSTPLFEAWQHVDRPQRILVMGPMYHTNGFAALNYLLAGDRVFVLERFDAALAVDVLERHRISTFTATPTMLQRIADLPGIDGRDLSSLVFVLQGAAAMPPSLVHRWAALIGAQRLLMAYGMTEGLGLAVIRADEWMTHVGSVGRGYRGTEPRILGDDLAEVPTGEIGEIYLRSPSFAGAVYVGGGLPLRSTDDGFHSAGDLGYLDDEGYLYVVDRREDLIITGGANVYPAEVEAALIDHPQIADVVVIGLRDPEWGRRVHAIVEPTEHGYPPSVEEVIRYAKSRLAPYKVPKTVELVDSIPRSAATKVSRSALVDARGG